MPSSLHFLLLIYAGVISVNILICLVLWKKQRDELYAWLLLLWFSMVAGFAISGINADKGQIYFAFADIVNTILVFTAIITLTYKLLGKTLRYRYYFLAPMISLVLYLGLSFIGMPFVLKLLLSAVIINIPLLHTAYIILHKPQRKLNTASMNLLGIIIIAFSLNSLTYPFTRLIPEYPPYGFSIALILLFAISILAPAIIQEVIAQRRLDKIKGLEHAKAIADNKVLAVIKDQSKNLEIEVRERTNELIQANATKDQLFAIISHDLRGPIYSLNSMVHELICEGEALDNEIVQALRNTTKNLYSLADSLLSWASSQKGQLQLNTITATPEQILSMAHQDLCSEAKQKQLELTIGDSCSTPTLSDMKLTQIVLRNLISNALKFTPANGSIVISSKQDGDYVRFQVHDNGQGMCAAQLAGLFEIGKDNLSTLGISGEVGNGFGLMLCQEFVKIMGGEIGAESEFQQGSLFWFTLPIAQQA